MFNISDFSVQFNYSIILLLLGILVIAAITYYYYKYTIPAIDTKIKVLLFILRFTALSLILLLIFEPLIHINFKNEIRPKNLFFFDNSSSITAKDSLKTKEYLENLFIQIKDKIKGDIEFYTFGKDVSKISEPKFNFSESTTNFEKIFNLIANKNENIATINIISDGIITDGVTPISKATQIGIPVNIIALGDTNKNKEVFVSNIITGEYLYTNTKSNIEILVKNNFLEGKVATIQLFEDSKEILNKDIVLSSSGIDKIIFEYLPKQPGEVKLTAKVTLKDKIEANFSKTYLKIIKVLSSKVKIVLLSSLPSPDISFIYNALKLNENYQVIKILQVSTNYLNNAQFKSIDSANVFVLINFPTNNTPMDLLNKVISKIEAGKPFLFVLGESIDFNKLKLLENYTPFIVKSVSTNKISIECNIKNYNSNLLKANNPLFSTIWNNLPPVTRYAAEFVAKPESDVLLNAKIAKNITELPLILSRSLGKKRSIAILASNIWRWKLNVTNGSEELFNGFFNESIKWLNVASEQSQLQVKPIKQIFAKGEPVEFIAYAYDEAFNPLDNAEIKIKSKIQDIDYETVAEAVGNGIYQAKLNIPNAGYFSFSATANFNGKSIGNASGKFSIGEVDLEKINLLQDRNFLLSLAGNTGGNLYNTNNYLTFIDDINKKTINTAKFIISQKEFKLWNFEFILFLIILIFALEWIIRKKSGLL